jgi:hypothetical protein
VMQIGQSYKLLRINNLTDEITFLPCSETGPTLAKALRSVIHQAQTK